MPLVLDSLYDFYRRKYPNGDDHDLRRRLMEWPQGVLMDLADITLVTVDAISGIKVVDCGEIDGFTHTTAETTVVIPSPNVPITVKKYFENKKTPLLHPQLPLLAVRKDKKPDARVHFDFVSGCYRCEI